MKLRNPSRWAANAPTGTEEGHRGNLISFKSRMKRIATTRESAVLAGFSASC
jgi:hypothetical protein